MFYFVYFCFYFFLIYLIFPSGFPSTDRTPFTQVLSPLSMSSSHLFICNMFTTIMYYLAFQIHFIHTSRFQLKIFIILLERKLWFNLQSTVISFYNAQSFFVFLFFEFAFEKKAIHNIKVAHALAIVANL